MNASVAVGLLAFLSFGSPVLSLDEEAAAAVSDASYREVFTQRYCVDCHGGLEPEAGLDLAAVPYDLIQPRSLEPWSLALEYVEAGDMPPRRAPQPGPEEIARFLTEVRGDIETARREATLERPPLRRMNRLEQLNTVQDLLGIRGLQLPASFPEDATELAFDTMAEGLFASSAHLGASLQFATEVADRVIRLPGRPEVRMTSGPSSWERGVLIRDEFFFSGVNLAARGSALWDRSFSAPEPGVYRVRLRAKAQGTAGSDGRPLRLGFYAVEQAKHTFPDRVPRSELPRVGVMEVTGRELDWHSCVVHLEQGESFQVYCENRLPEDVPAGGWTREELWARMQAARESEAPTIVVDRMEIVGPRALLPRQAKLLGRQRRADEDYVRAVLLPLAERAYRRPLAEAEETELLASVMEHAGATPDVAHGLHYGLRRILCSPQFLYLNSGPEDDWALASRLSYFLWSSLPDARLLGLAASGRLSEPDVLQSEVRRLIADPKAKRFVESFAGQWLSGREAAGVMVCDVRHLWSELIRYGYLRSTELFFQEILLQNRSIRTFIDSDFTYANEPMRIAWGFPGDHPAWEVLEDRQVQSSTWPEPERLDLAALEPGVPAHVAGRGGVLGLSSVLLATGDGVESSPILRGVWVLENLFGTPTPPPPDDVPALVADLSKAKSVREVIEAHQAAESCAKCHVRIDPLGLALERYDAIGNWRSEYEVRFLDADGNESFVPMPLETKSVLPDGTELDGPADIKAYLMANPELFTRCLTGKLIEYAVGRELTPGDIAVLEEIVASEPLESFGLQDLIVAIVQSRLFRPE